jgi:hypothetical protein
MRKHLLSYRDDMRVEVEHGIPVTAVHREAHVKTKSCPDCNGDGVMERIRTMSSNAQHAVAVVSCLMTMMMKK